jgi:hypothetical protein
MTLTPITGDLRVFHMGAREFFLLQTTFSPNHKFIIFNIPEKCLLRLQQRKFSKVSRTRTQVSTKSSAIGRSKKYILLMVNT